MKTFEAAASRGVKSVLVTKLQTHGMVVIGLVLAVFAYLAAITQFFDEDFDHYGVISLAQLALKAQQIASITNMVEFELKENPFDGACRRLDLALPPNARIYMGDMLGTTNQDRALMYAALAYYSFPRDVATSLDRPALITRDGYVGRAAQYYQELATNGFDVEVTAQSDSLNVTLLRPLELRPLASPEWFHSRQDWFVAFMLPLLTALAGLWLLQLLFPALNPRMRPTEKLACGLGLGMIAVATLTLGVKLLGLHGTGLVLLAAGSGAIMTCWKYRHTSVNRILEALWEVGRNPAVMVGALFFFVVFRAAGINGLIESDAVAAWMLKAKILHLHTGREIVRWFSEPRLAHAHFDYPTLVSSLHAATFDSLGHVDEYVTKFWPAWMLLLLVGGLASLNSRNGRLLFGVSFFLLALVLLPTTRQYVQMEGSTLPMLFFTALGLLQCALGQAEQDAPRLWLGLSLLFGAAMTKFEGAITLAATLLWLLLLPSSRSAFALPRGAWRVFAFCAVAAVPYFRLRVQIPALHYESEWARYMLGHPLETLWNLPGFLMMMTARWFLSPTLADWNAEGDGLHWSGHWEGFASLYNHPTLGLAWLALALTLALWFKAPARRSILLWLIAVIGTVLVAFSAVFSGFVSTMGRSRALEHYTAEIASGRYLFPILVAWSAIVVTLLYREAETAPHDLPDPVLGGRAKTADISV